MSITTTSVSGSYFIKENLDPTVVDGVFRKTPFLNTFREMGRVLPVGGAATLEWNWIYADQSAAAALTENQTFSEIGGTLSTRASKSPQYGAITFGVSEIQMINSENGGLTVPDILEQEAGKATESLYKYFEDLFCGSSAGVGISSLIDSTGNVEGIDASSFATWAAVETSVSASYLIDKMDSVYHDLMSRNTSLQDLVIFCSPAVSRIYGNANSGSLRGFNGGPVTDYGKGMKAFEERPIVACPGMSDTEMYFVDMSDASIVVTAEPRTKQIPLANLGENHAVYGAMTFKLGDRRRHGKLTQINLRLG